MNKKLIASLAIILGLAMLTSCSSGVSQTKYDSAVAEKNNIQRQITEIKNQLIAVQNKLYELQTSGGSASDQTGPTDMTRVSWRPSSYIDKTYGFKVFYPNTWKLTAQARTNIPFERYHVTDNVPGAWVGLIYNTTAIQATQLSLDDLVSSWADYTYITSGETILADNTPASYIEFNATTDDSPKHIYAVGYVDNDHWVYYAVFVNETIMPWDGNLVRQVAHTLNKATPAEIATGTATPPTTPATATPTTAAPAVTTYTDTKYKFSFSYPSFWTVWDPATDTSGHRVFGAASAEWVCPGVRIDKLPASTAATLFELIPSVLGTQANPEKSTTEEITNDNGIKVTAHVIKYTSPTDGYRLDAKIYGFIKDGVWWTMVVYQSDGLGTLQGQNPDKIFNSWKFN